MLWLLLCCCLDWSLFMLCYFSCCQICCSYFPATLFLQCWLLCWCKFFVAASLLQSIASLCCCLLLFSCCIFLFDSTAWPKYFDAFGFFWIVEGSSIHALYFVIAPKFLFFDLIIWPNWGLASKKKNWNLYA